MEHASLFNSLGMAVFALLAIMNPFGNLPVFMSMSEDLTRPTRDKLFRTVVLVAAVIVIVFALVGNIIMTVFFRIGLPELRIAGGILLVVLGLKNLMAPQENKSHITPSDGVNESEQVHKRIIPMAFPILVGPGTLSTVIILEHEYGMMSTLLAVLISCAIIFILFMQANIIERFVGKLTLFVLSRIMQVFITAVGVRMLVTGLIEVFPLLGR